MEFGSMSTRVCREVSGPGTTKSTALYPGYAPTGESSSLESHGRTGRTRDRLYPAKIRAGINESKKSDH
eukprot:253113-Rhodomonas_salina.4